MGKIRVKAFDESQEEKDKKLEAKREAKKLAKKAGKEEAPEGEVIAAENAPENSEEPKKSKKAKFAKEKVHGKRYSQNLSIVDKKATYPLKNALEKLAEFQKSKFDETVELHINVKEKGLSGQLTLPHGTGKVRRIKIVDDEIIAAIEGGKLDFDVLVAHPSMMPKLAKVARILGPRGLMPNPKNGTVTPNPEGAVEKLAGGQVNYKTEASAPIIHMSVGKVSFGNEKLEENIQAVVKSVKAANIVSATVKSTMSPGVKISL